VDCQLRDGPTQDLNLMVRRDRAKARMARVEGVRQHVTPPGTVVAIYACEAPACVREGQGSLVVPARSLAWRPVPAGARLEVTGDGALWMEIESCR
jgi:environmental stress-induced protein Ves